MKNKILTILVLTILVTTGVMGMAPDKTLEVIYFHATRRCATCKAIEENTRKTLNTYFPEQMKNGTIKMTIINVDEEKNAAIAGKYEAAGSSLFLTRTVNGKETRTDMTDMAFSYARSNPPKFMTTLKDKINEIMK